MNLALALMTTAILVVGVVIGARRKLYATVIICLSLFAYHVFFPFLNEPPEIFATSPEALLKAQWLSLFGNALLVLVTLAFPRRRNTTETSQTSEDTGATLLRATLVASLVGFAAYLVLIDLTGGIGENWSRAFREVKAFAGLLEMLSSLVLLYPVVAVYLHLNGRHTSPRHLVFAGVVTVAVLFLFLLSGVTTKPIALFAPLGVILLIRGDAIRWKRLAGFCLIGILAVYVFRYARMWGELSEGGQNRVTAADVTSEYMQSSLKAHTSFGEFFAFSVIVEGMDQGIETLNGASYLLPVAMCIPGVLWEGKHDFLQASRPDAFVRDAFFNRALNFYVPSGFYGEAYLNFGQGGFFVVYLLYGVLLRWVDSRRDGRTFGLPGPLFIALSAAPILVSCRMHISAAANLIVFQLLAVWLLTSFFRFCEKKRKSAGLSDRPAWRHAGGFAGIVGHPKALSKGAPDAAV